MAAMEQAGVRSVINLDDSAETMRSYPDFPGSYYSRCAILNPEMGYDYESDEFAAKIRKCALFITETDGPWLIHCKEGKDRAGILCAILECFAGASADDVARDYMTTYYNYYGVRPQDAVYGIILNNNLYKTLTSLFKIDDMQTADLKQAAENYLASAGLTEDQLDMLRNKLMKP